MHEAVQSENIEFGDYPELRRCGSVPREVKAARLHGKKYQGREICIEGQLWRTVEGCLLGIQLKIKYIIVENYLSL